MGELGDREDWGDREEQGPVSAVQDDGEAFCVPIWDLHRVERHEPVDPAHLVQHRSRPVPDVLWKRGPGAAGVRSGLDAVDPDPLLEVGGVDIRDGSGDHVDDVPCLSQADRQRVVRATDPVHPAWWVLAAHGAHSQPAGWQAGCRRTEGKERGLSLGEPILGTGPCRLGCPPPRLRPRACSVAVELRDRVIWHAAALDVLMQIRPVAPHEVHKRGRHLEIVALGQAVAHREVGPAEQHLRPVDGDPLRVTDGAREVLVVDDTPGVGVRPCTHGRRAAGSDPTRRGETRGSRRSPRPLERTFGGRIELTPIVWAMYHVSGWSRWSSRLGSVSHRSSPHRSTTLYRAWSLQPVWSRTGPPPPATSAESNMPTRSSSHRASGSASSSMKATISPAEAAIPRLRDTERFLSGFLTTLTRPSHEASTSSVSSVQGPATTTTSKDG